MFDEVTGQENSHQNIEWMFEVVVSWVNHSMTEFPLNFSTDVLGTPCALELTRSTYFMAVQFFKGHFLNKCISFTEEWNHEDAQKGKLIHDMIRACPEHEDPEKKWPQPRR
jgi:hypothetical protein